MQQPDAHQDSIGTTDTLECVFREGPMWTPCSVRTRRPRAPTTIQAFRTFSLDRAADTFNTDHRSRRAVCASGVLHLSNGALLRMSSKSPVLALGQKSLSRWVPRPYRPLSS